MIPQQSAEGGCCFAVVAAERVDRLTKSVFEGACVPPSLDICTTYTNKHTVMNATTDVLYPPPDLCNLALTLHPVLQQTRAWRNLTQGPSYYHR